MGSLESRPTEVFPERRPGTITTRLCSTLATPDTPWWAAATTSVRTTGSGKTLFQPADVSFVSLNVAKTASLPLFVVLSLWQLQNASHVHTFSSSSFLSLFCISLGPSSPCFFCSFCVFCHWNLQVKTQLYLDAGITCSRPTLKPHGSIQPSRSSYDYGTGVTFTCVTEYRLRGATSALCSGAGSWSAAAPTCEGK